VIKEYFDLLFNEDTFTTGTRRSHHRQLHKSMRESSMVKRASTDPVIKALSAAMRAGKPEEEAESSSSPLHTTLLSSPFTFTEGNHENPLNSTATATTATATYSFQSNSSHDASLVDIFLGGGGEVGVVEEGRRDLHASGAVTGTLTFTEFLRVNMRLAEDRVLSFVLVFCTGFGTKWVPGATFYYSPEVNFQTLLTQRRRWINGTAAGYFFFFISKKARLRVQGGFIVSTLSRSSCCMLYKAQYK
jgi:hypothetical protein